MTLNDTDDEAPRDDADDAEELDPRQEQAALLVAGGRPLAEVAETVGVCVRTIQRWQKLGPFAVRVAELRFDMISEASGRMAYAMTRAVETLKELLDSTNPRIRMAAAKALLAASLRVRQHCELESEVRSYVEALKCPDRGGWDVA